ncbi:hypothetical protein ASG43_00470 [Aureimonas sp. Leaf454]|uniref:hypothetical protein n=1 Tax=Aureimonas sp. Leaf454 TaxID=1736381 RepID=UPI0006FAD5F0|nr:hypothetical protein [Aureimonas sp. Leaf454]KQT54141.1 hypothetical protein ASG43_00470 [Aureimonas sp. Leaf454]
MTTDTNRRAIHMFAAAALALPILAGTGLSFAQGTPAPAAPVAAAPAPAAPPAGSPAPAPITEIGALRDMSRIAIRGRVAEIFGGAFVLEDASGRALVETGPSGDERPLVAAGETVTVEGRFERGTLRAAQLTHEDGRRETLREPRGGGRGGPEEDARRGGPHGRHHGGPGPRGETEDGPRAEKRDEGGVFGWFSGGIDEAEATKVLTTAGYTELTLMDTGRHHAEFRARDAAGAEWSLTVNDDGELAEREPFKPLPTPEQARTAVEKLGYTYDGDVETRREHVEVDARTPAGRSVVVELNADGSLRKERFAD